MYEAQRYLLQGRKGMRGVCSCQVVSHGKGTQIGKADNACLPFLEEIIRTRFFRVVEEIVENLDDRD